MTSDQKTQEFLSSILEAHGGLERWKRTETIEVTWNFHGHTLAIKMGWSNSRQPTIKIHTDGEPNGVITGIDGDPHNRWIFKNDRVSIETVDGKVLQELSKPRSNYKGSTHTTPWDELHLHYFISYAMYNYLTTPFIFALPGFKITERESYKEFGETWRVLEVVYPDGFPTHTKTQLFYFDSETFLLRRIDYEVDIMRAPACHYCFDYKDFGGLKIPTSRRVVGRQMPGRVPLHTRPTVFGLQYISVKVTDKDGSVHENGEWVR